MARAYILRISGKGPVFERAGHTEPFLRRHCRVLFDVPAVRVVMGMRYVHYAFHEITSLSLPI